MIHGTIRGTEALTVTDIPIGKQLLAPCLFKSAIRNPILPKCLVFICPEPVEGVPIS